MPPDSDTIEFLADDAPPADAGDTADVWKLLIVDDDEEVHQATVFALHDQRLCGRRLQLLHARSAAESAALMGSETEIAVILLDVVMESPDAGLRLVRRIRQELGQTEVRIILRTGQPGHAPELEVIRDYDINDYKTKAELTHTRLITTLITAIRSYEQLRAINDNRRGQEAIVAAAARLMQTQTLEAFAKEALTQFAALLHLSGDGLVCAQKKTPGPGLAPGSVPVIVAASGSLAGYSRQPLAQLREPEIRAAIKDCLTRQGHFFGAGHCALYLGERGHEAVVLVRCAQAPGGVERQLAKVFAANVATCFGNVKLLERLNHVAYHDPLTGLPNRARFLVDLADAGALALTGQVVCLVDIVHFTDVNNTLGQSVGDQLLVAVARRLADFCGDGRVARVGGGRFGLLGSADRLASTRLLTLLVAPFVAGEHALQVNFAIGACRIDGRVDGELLYRRADMALTQVRLNPNLRYLEFAPEMEERTRWRLDVIRRLRQDFLAGQLAVWYQPQVSLTDDGAVVGLEALARWPGNGGFVHPPTVFVQLAEDAGLIVDLGAWVLNESCATYSRLRRAGCAPRHMAVNVSMPQFRQPDFPARVMDTLAAHAMPACALELEITESMLLDEPLVVLHNLETLRRAGVMITVDDFGTGYSSLGYLRQLPIDCLKIDRSFVSEIDSGKGDLFAETIIDLAHKLGMSTVAEGVETALQVSRLRLLGCDTAQGFLYAHPMPGEALAPWFADRAAA